jgi:hypothetical protein
LDGGSSAINLLTINNVITLADFIVQNNGASGTNVGITLASSCFLFRVVVNNVRGTGFHASASSGALIECEAYACNGGAGANLCGFNLGAGNWRTVRCIAHDNAGSTTHGFLHGTGTLIDCIADSNGGDGFRIRDYSVMSGCDAYNNGGDGLDLQDNTNGYLIENCNFIKNGGWGINGGGTSRRDGWVFNCGFGSGTQANTSGTTTNLRGITESGSLTYAANVTPWVDPANGDFRINLEAAQGTGRSVFTETAASYSGTVGYPDVGAAQHLEAAAGGVNRSILPSGLSALG